MAYYCYRWKGDKETHYGPIEAKDVPALLELLFSFRTNREDVYDVTFWEIKDKKNDYLYPPKPGSGIQIWCYSKREGRHVYRIA
jgi:hypothetical protein